MEERVCGSVESWLEMVNRGLVAWEINLIGVAWGGRRCARLRRAEGAERLRARERAERRGARAAERDSIADGTAEIASGERR